MPVDVPDIAGWTALQQITAFPYIRYELLSALLHAGANPNFQNRYGETALNGAFQHNHPEAVDLLMDHGADLSVRDANGIPMSAFYLSCGPQIMAVVSKWVKKLGGEEEGPRAEKQCDGCGEKQKALKNCGRCRVGRYCSQECQSMCVEVLICSSRRTMSFVM